MTKMYRCMGFPVMLCCWLLPAITSAQTGSIAGVARDTSGAVLPGVTVEAASPALIERVRSVVSDGQGQYRIVDLRPGTYSVTFTLPGFATVVRDGLELTSGFTAQVNAEMRVGGIEETVVVTGASPVVDIQNVRTQEVYKRDVLDALPFSKTFAAYSAMTPGVTGGATGGVATRDVGGSQGEAPIGLSVHGSDSGLTSVDGIKTVSMLRASVRRLNISDLYTQEVVVELGGGNAEQWSGGANIDVVFKDGGNRFGGTSFVSWTGEGMDTNNLTDALRARGLTTYNKQRKIYDFGAGVGGPIKTDKVWFFFAPRIWGNEYYVPGNYYNATPHTLFYTPDLSRPAIFDREQWDLSGRVTVQATPKNKFTVTSITSYQCFCPFAVEGGSVSPDGASTYLYWPQRYVPVTWNFPATNRVLIEGAVAWRSEGVDASADRSDGSLPTDISVLETTINRQYGSHFSNYGPTDYWKSPSHHWYGRGAVSYVTGSHSFKTGFSTLNANEILGYGPNYPFQYVFRNQVPLQIRQVATPAVAESRIRVLGLFAQDQWTLDRLTLNLGLRFDAMSAHVPAQTRQASEYIAAIAFDKVSDIPNWKDVHPRVGVAYDLFGNGKTALKVALGSYWLNSNYSLGLTRTISPLSSIVTRTSRTWNDVNGNFAPDCDLHLKGANGECGAMLDQAFGTTRVTTHYADDVTQGWGVGPKLWQTSVSVQHEILPGVGLTAGYYRTWYPNQTVTDNLSVTPADFDSYCLTTPADSRLPGGGGQQVCGFKDVNFAKFGQADNLVVLAPDNTQVFNGVDVGMNARIGNGVLVRGGVSTAHEVIDNCSDPDTPNSPFCKTTRKTIEFKGTIVYPLPWWGLQTSAVIQNIPGLFRSASYVANNAEIAPTLGRNLSACVAPTGACTATVTLGNIVEPFTLKEPRGNQVDLRVSKLISVGGLRIQGNFDAYNLFNVADVLSMNSRYGGAWLNAVSTLAGRMYKVSAQLNF